MLRHGEAGKRMTADSRDKERGLTAAGREELEKVAAALAEMDFDFDVIAASPLKRAKDSASIVAKALGSAKVEEWQELSPEGSREALYRRLAKVKPGSSVLCVGHEPYLTSLIGEATTRGAAGSATFRIALKKAGMAKLVVNTFSPRIVGELRWLLTPRQIRKMA